MILQITKPAKSVTLTTIVDDKFKTSHLSIRFICELDEKYASANALAFQILPDSNSIYPDTASMSAALGDLYGACIGSATYKCGDFQINSIGASWINDEYAYGGEDITKEVLNILKNCLISPAADENGFKENVFNIAKRDLTDSLKSIINNKSYYAAIMANRLAFRGESAAIPARGTPESVAELTPAFTMEAYKHLLEKATVMVYFCSSHSDLRVHRLLCDVFDMEREAAPIPFYLGLSAAKSVPETVTEIMDVQQCHMVMTFKSHTADKLSLRFLSIILGETPVSRLFRILREQESLCYSCSSGSNFLKNTITVECGIDYRNAEKVQNMIHEQIKDISRGNVSDEEISAALKLLDTSLENVGDTPDSWIDWYFECDLDQHMYSPCIQMNEYRRVTKEVLALTAASLHFDSVFILKGNEEEVCNG